MIRRPMAKTDEENAKSTRDARSVPVLRGDRRWRLSPAAAHLFAWLAVAFINAIGIASYRVGFGGLATRAWWHLYDAGHIIALGLVSSAVVGLWGRFGPKRRVWAYVACAGAAAAVGWFVIRESLRGFAEQIAASRGMDAASEPEPYLSLLTFSTTLCIPGALLAGHLLSRPILRWFAAAIALDVLLVNERLLEGDYHGIHFYLVWASTMLAASALAGVKLPHRLAAFWQARPRVIMGLQAVGCLVAAYTLAVWPAHGVVMRLWKLEGSILVPSLAKLHAPSEGDTSWGDSFGNARRALPPIPASEPPMIASNAIVLLLSVDAIRAELLAGEYDDRLPNMAASRDESVYFSVARTPAAGTRMTMASLFSGLYFSQLPWANPASTRPVIRDVSDVRFPEVLSDHGVRTVNLVCEYRVLVRKAGIVGRFDEEKVFPPTEPGRFSWMGAAGMIDGVIERLNAVSEDRPVFIFTHLLDPHRPYDLAGKEGTQWERYVREVQLVDTELGRLRKHLEDTGLWARTTLIVTSDHGEGHGLHGAPYHNRNVYEEAVRVPLSIRVPGVEPRVVETPVSIIDLGPTIVDLMGAPTPGAFMGESLVPHLRGEDHQHVRPIVMEHKLVRGMVTADNLKVIVDKKENREEIYDLTDDPEELKNLRDALGPRGDQLTAELLAFFRENAPRGDAIQATIHKHKEAADKKKEQEKKKKLEELKKKFNAKAMMRDKMRKRLKKRKEERERRPKEAEK